MIGPSAKAAGVTLEVDLDDVGVVTADAGRMQQVVWNLLANAVKFTARGGQVKVELRSKQDHAVIFVADSGVGIKPEFLPRLFERFSQSDGSITRQFGGLGLGLSIVHKLVELHGGSVTAHSDGEGRGATFTVHIPLWNSAQRHNSAMLRRPAGELAGMERSLPDLNGMRILMVDDDPDAREMLNRVLAERGATVLQAGSAQEALSAVQAHQIDVLVSDIGMPGTDGYELLRQIRRLAPSGGGRIPAIALTAFARPEDRTRVLEAGYALHFTKPIDPMAVLSGLERLHHAKPSEPDTN